MPKVDPVKLLAKSTQNQRKTVRKTLRKTKGKTKATPAKAAVENPSSDTESVSPWELEKAQTLRERAIGRGGELAAFYEGLKTDVFMQSGRRMPYFDQVQGEPVKLLWPPNGCGVFNMSDGSKGLACIRMVKFDKNTQKGELLVEWIYTPQEAIAYLAIMKPRNQAKLKKILRKMDDDEDLLLSNHLDVVSTCSLLGPAIEPEGESRCINHHFDVVQWSIVEIEAKPVRELVRPAAWDPVNKIIGEVMDEAEFLKQYGHHAAPQGLLPDDLHPVVDNPLCILQDLGFDQDVEKQRKKRQDLQNQYRELAEQRFALMQEKEQYLLEMQAILDLDTEGEDDESGETDDDADVGDDHADVSDEDMDDDGHEPEDDGNHC